MIAQSELKFGAPTQISGDYRSRSLQHISFISHSSFGRVENSMHAPEHASSALEFYLYLFVDREISCDKFTIESDLQRSQQLSLMIELKRYTPALQVTIICLLARSLARSLHSFIKRNVNFT